MSVKRIVADIAVDDPSAAAAFWRDFFGMDVAMDMGWIVTLAAPEHAQVQITLASEGGSGAPVPDLSIEVDNVDALWAKAHDLGLELVYPLTDEPWGVRRFFVREPSGKVVNVLAHIQKS